MNAPCSIPCYTKNEGVRETAARPRHDLNLCIISQSSVVNGRLKLTAGNTVSGASQAVQSNILTYN